MAKGFTFVGSDAARAKALSRKPRTPKFAIGVVVMDAYGDIAAVEGIFADLRAVEDAGIVEDAAAWLAKQEKKPKTATNGTWYTLVYGHGAGLAGEKDLKLAPPGSKSNPDT